MSGGDILPSDELFVYKPSKAILANGSEMTQEKLSFNYRFDNEVKPDFSLHGDAYAEISHRLSINPRVTNQMSSCLIYNSK